MWFGLVVGGCAVGPGTLYLQPVPALAWFSCLWQVQHYMPCFFNASLDDIHASIVKQAREEGRKKNAYMYIRHTQGKWDVSTGLCTELAPRCTSRFFNASYTQQYIYICRVSVACDWRPGVGLYYYYYYFIITTTIIIIITICPLPDLPTFPSFLTN